VGNRVRLHRTSRFGSRVAVGRRRVPHSDQQLPASSGFSHTLRNVLPLSSHTLLHSRHGQPGHLGRRRAGVGPGEGFFGGHGSGHALAARRILEIFGSLKGAALKAGQTPSLFADALPPELRAAMATLFSQAPTLPFEKLEPCCARSWALRWRTSSRRSPPSRWPRRRWGRFMRRPCARARGWWSRCSTRASPRRWRMTCGTSSPCWVRWAWGAWWMPAPMHRSFAARSAASSTTCASWRSFSGSTRCTCPGPR
jgi:hypothetical protein